MTKEFIEQRRAALAVDMENVRLERDKQQRFYDTLNGAIQDCDHWLAEIAKAETLVESSVQEPTPKK